MAKLPAISSKKLIKFLESCGFSVHRYSGSHCVLRKKNPKRMIVVPVHTRDLPKGTILAVLRESELSKSKLISYLQDK